MIIWVILSLPFVPVISWQCPPKLITLTPATSSGAFASPGYPSHVLRVRCTTTFKAPSNSRLKIACQADMFRSCLRNKLGVASPIGSKILCRKTTYNEVFDASIIRLSYISWVYSYYNRGVKCVVSIDQPRMPQCQCGIRKSPRIVGGTEAKPNSIPWQALLRRRSDLSHFCGGSMIDNRFILTAAHCVLGRTKDDIIVTMAEHDKLTDDPISKNFIVDVIHSHPSYNSATEDSDIAILELSGPVSYTNEIQPICLPFELGTRDFSGLTMTSSGWGRTSMTGDTSAVLLEADLIYVSTQSCTQDPYTWSESSITANMFCASGGSTKDTCQGDSGGPIFWKGANNYHYQIGVVSFGQNCADAAKPGVYTKLLNYLDWIKTTTKITNFCSPNGTP